MIKKLILALTLITRFVGYSYASDDEEYGKKVRLVLSNDNEKGIYLDCKKTAIENNLDDETIQDYNEKIQGFPEIKIRENELYSVTIDKDEKNIRKEVLNFLAAEEKEQKNNLFFVKNSNKDFLKFDTNKTILSNDWTDEQEKKYTKIMEEIEKKLENHGIVMNNDNSNHEMTVNLNTGSNATAGSLRKQFVDVLKGSIKFTE